MSTDWLGRELSILNLRLKKEELTALASNFALALPLDDKPSFQSLLEDIDRADEAGRRCHWLI